MKGRKPPPPPTFDEEQFLVDRKAALLSMDKATIVAYMQKYAVRPPTDDETFWRGIHKARTAARDLPMEARQESKRWLLAHGSQPMDDGEVPL
jgi:hypothetical protein